MTGVLIHILFKDGRFRQELGADKILPGIDEVKEMLTMLRKKRKCEREEKKLDNLQTMSEDQEVASRSLFAASASHQQIPTAAVKLIEEELEEPESMCMSLDIPPKKLPIHKMSLQPMRAHAIAHPLPGVPLRSKAPPLQFLNTKKVGDKVTPAASHPLPVIAKNITLPALAKRKPLSTASLSSHHMTGHGGWLSFSSPPPPPSHQQFGIIATIA